MTRRGAELLRSELNRLKNEERPRISAAIRGALARRPFSEKRPSTTPRAIARAWSSGAHAATSRRKLANAQVVDPKTLHAEGPRGLGATVELEEQSGRSATLADRRRDEATIREGRIPSARPSRRALIASTPRRRRRPDHPAASSTTRIVDRPLRIIGSGTSIPVRDGARTQMLRDGSASCEV